MPWAHLKNASSYSIDYFAWQRGDASDFPFEACCCANDNFSIFFREVRVDSPDLSGNFDCLTWARASLSASRLSTAKLRGKKISFKTYWIESESRGRSTKAEQCWKGLKGQSEATKIIMRKDGSRRGQCSLVDIVNYVARQFSGCRWAVCRSA
jgi:hypothetical protein